MCVHSADRFSAAVGLSATARLIMAALHSHTALLTFVGFPVNFTLLLEETGKQKCLPAQRRVQRSHCITQCTNLADGTIAHYHDLAFPRHLECMFLGTLEATDTLRRGYWLGLPLDMSNDDDLKASRNALGHSRRRIPHPLSQTRLRTKWLLMSC